MKRLFIIFCIILLSSYSFAAKNECTIALSDKAKLSWILDELSPAANLRCKNCKQEIHAKLDDAKYVRDAFNFNNNTDFIDYINSDFSKREVASLALQDQFSGNIYNSTLLPIVFKIANLEVITLAKGMAGKRKVLYYSAIRENDKVYKEENDSRRMKYEGVIYINDDKSFCDVRIMYDGDIIFPEDRAKIHQLFNGLL